jgi:hypothetical protein
LWHNITETSGTITPKYQVMAKTSKRKGRSTETGPFQTGLEEHIQPRRQDRTEKKPGQIKEK